MINLDLNCLLLKFDGYVERSVYVYCVCFQKCTFYEVRHISFNDVLRSMDLADQKEIRDIYINF